MVFSHPIHVISNQLSMVYRTLYPWHIKLSTHGISNPLPWYIERPIHGISNPVLWYIDTPIHGILNLLSMVF